MAHFHGSVQGSRGEATRLGGREAGIRTTAQNSRARVHVSLYNDDGIDRALVNIQPSSLNYGSSNRLGIAHGLDINALLAQAGDPEVSALVDEAKAKLVAASELAADKQLARKAVTA